MTQHLIICRCGYRAWKPTPNYRHKCIVRKEPVSAVHQEAQKMLTVQQCQHLGEPTGFTAESKTCRSSIRQVDVYECDIHGICTQLTNTEKNLQSCLKCKDKTWQT